MIDITKVAKSYDRHQVLQPMTLSIGDGITALLGPNGAGKTTLMNIIATLLTPTQGQVHVGGYDVQRQKREVRQLLGFLPQDFGLYDQLTAQEFLDYIGLLKGVRDRKNSTLKVLEQVGLSQEAKRRIKSFSGGDAAAAGNSPGLAQLACGPHRRRANRGS